MSLKHGNTFDSLNNRKNFLSGLGIDYRDLVCVQQVHSINIAIVGSKDKGKGSLTFDSGINDTDALITDERNVPLAVFTADCLSVFLSDMKKGVIGIVHAGWRGTQSNITGETVKLMKKKFNTEAKDLRVAFGPVMRQCCYEVGEEFKGLFSQGLKLDGNRIFLDIAAINKNQLLNLGLNEEQIVDYKICTSCQNSEFISFRKEGKTCARMMSVIMLK